MRFGWGVRVGFRVALVVRGRGQDQGREQGQGGARIGSGVHSWLCFLRVGGGVG